MIHLRNNTLTTDKRLDRLPHFDERSRGYPIRQLTPAKAPRSYTWRCNLNLDQGSEGACVGMAMVHEMAARPAEVSDLGYEDALKIYWEAQKIDPWEGGSYPGAVPRYEGTSVIAGCRHMLKINAAAGYRWAFGLDDLMIGVGYHGPAVIGVSWYENMATPDADGFVSATGARTGGHAILVSAVNVRGGFFTLHNSWGTHWGIEGTCRIAFEDMNRLLYDNGEAVFFVDRNTKPY